jgi:hypothetical protein
MRLETEKETRYTVYERGIHIRHLRIVERITVIDLFTVEETAGVMSPQGVVLGSRELCIVDKLSRDIVRAMIPAYKIVEKYWCLQKQQALLHKLQS